MNISRSGRASPGGSTAFSDRGTVRLTLVLQPGFSAQPAAGRTTSASCAVSVRYRSETTRNTESDARARRIRAESGIETAGLVACTHRKPIDPCSTYRMICMAWVGGDQCGIDVDVTEPVRVEIAWLS